MSNVENVWEFSTPESGFAFYLNCGFRWHNNEQFPGPFVGIKINSGQYIDIFNYFRNGVYKGYGLEISFRGEKLKTCNYINIIMSIKSTDSSISKFSISNSFDTYIGTDYHNVRGLSGFRGWRGFDDSHSVSFIFNNSQKVTPVSYASYSTYGSFWKQDPIDDKTIIQSSRGLSLSWEDRKISEGEVQEIRYSIGIGEYIVGYVIEVKTKIEEFYSPGSEISLNIDVLDNFIGDHLKITRIIDSGDEITIYDEDDNGEHVNIDDNFTLPRNPGSHTIKYITKNNESSTIEKIIQFKIKSKPNISITPTLSFYYDNNETVNVTATIFDEKSVTLKVLIDDQTIINLSVDCNGNFVNKTVIFQIPFGEYETEHIIRIFCVDILGTNSSEIIRSYTLKEVHPPVIQFNENLSYILPPKLKFTLRGNIMNPDGTTKACLKSYISNDYYNDEGCRYINQTWSDFTIERTIPAMEGGIYSFEITCVDSNFRYSVPYNHTFALSTFHPCKVSVRPKGLNLVVSCFGYTYSTVNGYGVF